MNPLATTGDSSLHTKMLAHHHTQRRVRERHRRMITMPRHTASPIALPARVTPRSSGTRSNEIWGAKTKVKEEATLLGDPTQLGILTIFIFYILHHGKQYENFEDFVILHICLFWP